MNEYLVYVSREETMYIPVTADNKEDAGKKALELAENDVPWGLDDPRYSILVIEEEDNGYKENGNEDKQEDDGKKDGQEERKDSLRPEC